MKKFNLSIIILFLLLISCNREKLDGDKSRLIGTWQWQYSYVYNPNGVNPLSPVDTIYASEYPTTYTMEFEAKGIMSWYEGNNEKLRTNLKFNYANCVNVETETPSCAYRMNENKYGFNLEIILDQPVLSNWSSGQYDYFPHLIVNEGYTYNNAFYKN